MSDAGEFSPLSADDLALIEAAGPIGDKIIAAIAEGDGKLDVRLVAIACGSIVGSFAFGLPDPEFKREAVRHWCERMIAAAGVPLAVVGRQ